MPNDLIYVCITYKIHGINSRDSLIIKIVNLLKWFINFWKKFNNINKIFSFIYL